MIGTLSYYQGAVFLYLSNYIQFRCLLISFLDEDTTPETEFAVQQVSTCLFPVLFILFVSAIICIMESIKSSGRSKDLIRTASVVIFYLTHTDICRDVFKSFSCWDV